MQELLNQACTADELRDRWANRGAGVADYALRQGAGRRQGRGGAYWAPARSAIQTGIGPVTVQIPKVRAKGKPVTFHSGYRRMRKTALEAALPWLYLKGWALRLRCWLARRPRGYQPIRVAIVRRWATSGGAAGLGLLASTVA